MILGEAYLGNLFAVEKINCTGGHIPWNLFGISGVAVPLTIAALFTLSGILYVAVFGLLAIGLNKVFKWYGSRKKYDVRFVERDEKI